MPHDIRKVAQEIQSDISGLHLVGSLARGKKSPKDIDFITLKDLPNGKKYIHFTFKGYHVDIWKVKNIKVGKFLRTYKKEHVIAIYRGLKKNGYKLLDDGIQDFKTGKIIPFTIKRVFEFAGLPYRPVRSP